MQSIQTVRCPNCGSLAQRRIIRVAEGCSCWQCSGGDRVTQLECSRCDYLMVSCTSSGNVVEAYAPGIPGSV